MNNFKSILLTATLLFVVIFTLSCDTKCGETAYNPATHFCFENKIYEQCGAVEYNPKTHFCVCKHPNGNFPKGFLAELCGGKEYNYDDGDFCGDDGKIHDWQDTCNEDGICSAPACQ